jgi:phage terminase large subunit GpA-like protein
MICPKCGKEFTPAVKRTSYKRGPDCIEEDWLMCPHCRRWWEVVGRFINGKIINAKKKDTNG